MDHWTIRACELLLVGDVEREAYLGRCDDKVRTSLEAVMRSVAPLGEGELRKLLDDWRASSVYKN